jgi:hypothetical protein
MSSWSIQPPKYPDSDPMTRPMATESVTVASPTMSEMRAP